MRIISKVALLLVALIVLAPSTGLGQEATPLPEALPCAVDESRAVLPAGTYTSRFDAPIAPLIDLPGVPANQWFYFRMNVHPAYWANVTVKIDWGNVSDYDLHVYDRNGVLLGNDVAFNELSLQTYARVNLSALSHCMDLNVRFANFSGTRQPLQQAELSVTVTPLPGAPNFALGVLTDASSVEPGTGHSAENAVDGDTSTRWSSANTDDQWLQVQLGEAVTVRAVVIEWDDAFGRRYQIQTSPDGASWATAAEVTEGDGGMDVVELPPTETQYVRMRGLERGGQSGYSISELRVHGWKANGA